MRNWTPSHILTLTLTTCLVMTLYGDVSAGEVGNVGSTSSFFQDNDADYVGGRGLITAEGPSGMYLNPTSGTLAKGQFTAQFFSSGLEDNFNNTGYYNALLSYGVTDWFEVGAVGYVRDLDRNIVVLNASSEPVLQPDGHSTAAAWPMARILILKDEQWWPEFSIGGYASIGHDSLDKATIFGAAYKRFVIQPKGFLRSIGFHTGVRQLWQDSDASAQRSAVDLVGYFGGEIELPNHLYLVSEVGTKEDDARFVPFSVGAQLRLPQGYGLSLAALQPGDQRTVALP